MIGTPSLNVESRLNQKLHSIKWWVVFLNTSKQEWIAGKFSTILKYVIMDALNWSEMNNKIQTKNKYLAIKKSTSLLLLSEILYDKKTKVILKF